MHTLNISALYISRCLWQRKRLPAENTFGYDRSSYISEKILQTHSNFISLSPSLHGRGQIVSKLSHNFQFKESRRVIAFPQRQSNERQLFPSDRWQSMKFFKWDREKCDASFLQMARETFRLLRRRYTPKWRRCLPVRSESVPILRFHYSCKFSRRYSRIVKHPYRLISVAKRGTIVVTDTETLE